MVTEMYRIFLVEDDETIAKLVRRHLEKWDYDVHVVQKFDAVMSEFASFDPHLVLMDIGLPFYNGYHWCTEIRRVSKVPVVFLSSAADKRHTLWEQETFGTMAHVRNYHRNICNRKWRGQ